MVRSGAGGCTGADSLGRAGSETVGGAAGGGVGTVGAAGGATGPRVSHGGGALVAGGGTAGAGCVAAGTVVDAPASAPQCRHAEPAGRYAGQVSQRCGVPAPGTPFRTR